MLKLFGSPRRNKAPKPCLVETLDGDQPCNPYTDVTVFSEHTDLVRILVRISSSRFASAGDDTKIITWDLKNAKKLHVLSAHSRPITCLHLLQTITPPGEQLLSAASDRMICFWDVDVGCLLRQLSNHQSTPRCFLSVPNSYHFCSAGDSLCLWTGDGRLLDTLRRNKEEDITQVIYLTDHRLVCTVDKRLVVYCIRERSDGVMELVMNRRLPSHRETIKCLLKINHACFVSGSLDGTIILWSTQALAPSRYFNTIEDYLGENRVYPHSVQALLCLEERYLVCAVGAGFCIYDIIPGRMVAEKCHAHFSKILCMSITHDGELLLTGSEDRSIRLWGSLKTFKSDCCEAAADSNALTRLLGISKEDLGLLREHGEKIEPHLVGKCLGHSGPVQVCTDAGTEGFLTSGNDGLIICWKDGTEAAMKQNGMLQNFYKVLNGPL